MAIKFEVARSLRAALLACALFVIVAATSVVSADGACYEVGLELFDRSGSMTTDVARVRVDGRVVAQVKPVRFSQDVSFVDAIGTVNAGVPLRVEVELAHSYAFHTLRDKQRGSFTLRRGTSAEGCYLYKRDAFGSSAVRIGCARCMVMRREPWCWKKGASTGVRETWYKVWAIRKKQDRC